MRQKAKVDDNHPEVVEALTGIGAKVQSLHTIGKGCPDLLVGWRGRNYLFEVKDGRKVPSRRALTEAQETWIADWPGAVFVVKTPEEAIDNLIVAALADTYLRRRIDHAEQALKHYAWVKNWKKIGNYLRRYIAGKGKQSGCTVANHYFGHYPNAIKLKKGKR